MGRWPTQASFACVGHLGWIRGPFKPAFGLSGAVDIPTQANEVFGATSHTFQTRRLQLVNSIADLGFTPHNSPVNQSRRRGVSQMRKGLAITLLFLLFALALTLHASNCNTMAGGTAVVIPTPEKDSVEVGSDKRNFFEYMVPSRNRLLCAFVSADLLPGLKNPATGMSQYMLVEVSRQLGEKNIEVSSANFEQVVSISNCRWATLPNLTR
jgi:predicted small secreted protein